MDSADQSFTEDNFTPKKHLALRQMAMAMTYTSHLTIIYLELLF